MQQTHLKATPAFITAHFRPKSVDVNGIAAISGFAHAGVNMHGTLVKSLMKYVLKINCRQPWGCWPLREWGQPCNQFYSSHLCWSINFSTREMRHGLQSGVRQEWMIQKHSFQSKWLRAQVVTTSQSFQHHLFNQELFHLLVWASTKMKSSGCGKKAQNRNPAAEGWGWQLALNPGF